MILFLASLWPIFWGLCNIIFGSLLLRVPWTFDTFFYNWSFAKEIDVVELGEVVNVGEVIVDDHDMSSSFHSWVPTKKPLSLAKLLFQCATHQPILALVGNSSCVLEEKWCRHGWFHRCCIWGSPHSNWWQRWIQRCWWRSPTLIDDEGGKLTAWTLAEMLTKVYLMMSKLVSITVHHSPRIATYHRTV